MNGKFARVMAVCRAFAMAWAIVAMATVARADSHQGGYTNHAGNVIAGWPVALTKTHVSLSEEVRGKSLEGGGKREEVSPDSSLPAPRSSLPAPTSSLQTPRSTLYPLSIFPPSERRRIAADFGEPILPRKVANAEAGVQREVRRALKRGEKGLIGKEESEKNANDLRAAFGMYLDASARDGVITESEKRAVMRRNGL